MITGAVAAVVYGEPRMTGDLDVVVGLSAADAARLVSAYPADAFYVPPIEVIEEEARRSERGHFNIIHNDSAMRADCYVAGRDPLHAWAMARRVRENAGGIPLWLAPIEYVIVRKLEWYRDGASDRHLDDVRAMLRVSGERADSAALQEWIARRGVEAEWQRVQKARSRH